MKLKQQLLSLAFWSVLSFSLSGCGLIDENWDKCATSFDEAKRLNDQAALAQIALDYKCPFFRPRAIRLITDQAILGRIVLEDKDFFIRQEAFNKLTDQTLLAQVAIESKEQRRSYLIRKAVIKKITDQTLLAQVAIQAKDTYVCLIALKKITDQTLLAQVAMEATIYPRYIATTKLDNRDDLNKIALRSNDNQAMIARLKLSLQHPLIVEKMGSLNLRIEQTLRFKHYRPREHILPAGASTHTRAAEHISMFIENSQTNPGLLQQSSNRLFLVATDTWNARFSSTIRESVYASSSYQEAPIDISNILCQVLTKCNFNQSDLEKLKSSDIPELREAAQSCK